MRDYGAPEGLPTPDEMWAKLTGQKTVTCETEQDYSELPTLAEFQKAMDRLMAKRGQQ